VAASLGYTEVFRDPKGFPEWNAEGLPVAKKDAELTGTDASPKPFGPIYGWTAIWTFIGIFAGGVALNLTPCVYPLIPITVSYFGGRSGKKKSEIFGHGVCYIIGLSLTTSTLGVVAALTGGLMGAVLQNPVVLASVSVILFLLATSLFGFWELRVPHRLTQAVSRPYAGYLGSLAMGVALGVVAAPCIGPFVLGLLTWVASIGNPLFGFIIFFTLSIGLGLPLFFLAMFSGRLDSLPRSGEWMLWVRKLMGWVLLVMATYFSRPLFPKTTGTLLFAAVFLAAGVHLGWIDRTRAGFRGFSWIKTIAGISGLVIATYLVGSFVLIGPGVDWQPYSDRSISEAVVQQQPVIIDFTADWCAPCRELDDITFRNSEIVKLTKQNIVMIKVDLTRKGDSDKDRLLRRYEIQGVPTIVFLDRQGNERRDLRLVDFVPADQFLLRVMEIKNRE